MSLRLHKKFHEWLDRWGEDNIEASARDVSKKWLMGEGNLPLKPCTTECKRDNDLGKSPYYPYNRYAVRYTRSNSPTESTKSNKAAAD